MKQKSRVLIVVAIGVAAVAILGLKDRQAASPGRVQAPRPAIVSGAPPAASPLPRLVDFGSVSCVPCKMMAPILAELDETYAGRFDVEFVDVWEDPGAGAPFRILAIPTQIFFDESGIELHRHEGFYSRAQILQTWRLLGYDFMSGPAPEA